jgi:hypothetical protein
MADDASAVVLLDIDGVLLPFGEGAAPITPPALFGAPALAALSHLLAESRAALVLSSTWRAVPAYVDDIAAEFRRYGAAHGGPLAGFAGFAGTTDPGLHSTRQREIHAWLTARRAAATGPLAWVALDDEPLLDGAACAALRPAFEGHVVQTESHEGLTLAQARRAVELLRAQHGGSAGGEGARVRAAEPSQAGCARKLKRSREQSASSS